jgi:hypothetical protein
MLKTISRIFVLMLVLITASNIVKAQNNLSTNEELAQKVNVVEDILRKVLFDQTSNSRNVFIWNSNKIETVISDQGILFTVNKVEALSEIVVVDGIRSIDVKKNDQQSTITLDMKEETIDKASNSKNPKKTTLEDLIPKIEDFFADYTLLLRELPDDATVTILIQNNKPRYVFRSNGNENIFGRSTYKVNDDKEKELRASVRMKDVRALTQGRINRNEFNKTISIEISSPKETPTDVSIFNNILETLYNQKNTQDYFISDPIGYADLGNIGYRFSLELYSAYREGSSFRIVAKNNEPNVNQTEKDQFVLDAYPKWKQNFLDHLTDYAITVKSFEKDKTIAFEVKLPSCPTFEDKMPNQLNISFTTKNLEDYRSGKISADKFKKTMNIQEMGK